MQPGLHLAATCATSPLTPYACLPGPPCLSGPPACLPPCLQVRRPIYTTSVGKWAAYKEGLAPLLLHLRSTILAYEQRAGLPSSRQLLDELQQQQAQQAAQAAEQQVQQAEGTCSAPSEGSSAGGSCGADDARGENTPQAG